MSTANVPRPAQLHNTDHSNALVLFIIAAATVVAFPASVVGALVTWAGWRAIKPDTLTQWLLAAVGTATVASLHSDLVFAWLLEFERLPPALEEFKPPGPISGRVRGIPGQAPAPANESLSPGAEHEPAELVLFALP